MPLSQKRLNEMRRANPANPHQPAMPVSQAKIAASAQAPAPANQGSLEKDALPYERKWGMVIDLDRCTGSKACEAACYAENNIPTVGPEQAFKGRAHQWIRVERYWEGEYPNVKARF